MKLHVIVIFFACCAGQTKTDQTLFFASQRSREFLCDTIFDSKLKAKFIAIQFSEKAEGLKEEINEKVYYQYEFAHTKDNPGMYLRQEGNKIYILIGLARERADFYKEELFFDFDSAVGHQWKLTYGGGGVFSNSILTVDSIQYHKSDTLYSIHASRIHDATDLLYLKAFRLSKANGVVDLSVVNGPSGDIVHCVCVN
jgi:hypothetical protein